MSPGFGCQTDQDQPVFWLEERSHFRVFGPKIQNFEKISKFFFQILETPTGAFQMMQKIWARLHFWANKATLKKRPFWALERGTQLKRAISRPGRHVAQKFFCRASSSTHGVPPSHSDRSYGIFNGHSVLTNWVFLLLRYTYVQAQFFIIP